MISAPWRAHVHSIADAANEFDAKTSLCFITINAFTSNKIRSCRRYLFSLMIAFNMICMRKLFCQSWNFSIPYFDLVIAYIV